MSTSRVLKIMVESGAYEQTHYMCDALGYASGGLTPSGRISISVKAARHILTRELLTDSDIYKARLDVQDYVTSFGALPYDTLCFALCRVAGVTQPSGSPTKFLTPLFMDWENRPQTTDEVIAYVKEHLK